MVSYLQKNNFLSLIFSSVINHYRLTLLLCLSIFLFFLFYAFRISIDASSESLVYDDNQNYKTYENIVQNYQGSDFLLLAYTPKSGDVFSKDSITFIENLSQTISKLDAVQSTLSIANAPLLKSIKDSSLQDNIKANANILSPQIDINLAKEEILNNPFFKENIISEDSKTAGIVVFLKSGFDYSHTIDEIKKIKNSYKDEMYIGGVPLIVDDIVYYIKSDLLVYTLLLGLILAVVMWLFFRNLSFVILSIVVCIFTLAISSGIFALLGYKITIVSSNYISILFVVNISLIIHLIVSYLENIKKYKNADKKRLILITALQKTTPSFYAIATTMIGFLGLMFANIMPIVHLGVVMAVGVLVALIFTFVIFMSFMMLVRIPREVEFVSLGLRILEFSSNIAINNKLRIYFVAFLCVVFSVYGIRYLSVENSFINYFKSGSEIKEGLLVIDENLGGTIPLEVIVKFATNETKDSINDEFESEFEELAKEDKYFFSEEKLRIAKRIHEYFLENEYAGSILSLHSVSLLLEELGLKPDGFTFSFLYDNLDESLKLQLFYPYANIQQDELRFVVRILDSSSSLKRDEFIKQVKLELANILENENVSFEVNGLMVLYNDLLQSLISSQVDTLLFVMLIIFVLFVLVFRSFKLAIIAFVANMIPLCVVFGILGISGISLDIMTATIAAISLGMGVDHAIHYIHRYKEEIKTNSKETAIRNSHKSIGNAMYYTAVVIIIGFLTMTSSSFVPTIYFGIITSAVMILMLISSLILLPRMLLIK